MNNASYSPLEDRILVKPIKKTDEKTESGLYIPDTVKKDVAEGIVAAVGLGRYAPETGVFINTVLNRGDHVLFGANEGMPIEVDKETHILMREGSVLLLIKKNEE